jgi:cation transport regulator ChaC
MAESLAMTTLYFAYGSNLGPSIFRQRCARARHVGIARVDGYRIGFTRWSPNRRSYVADLVPTAGAVVWGALYDLADDGFDFLDRCEGVPTGYRREVWSDFVRPDATPVAAHVYTVVTKAKEKPPARSYWDLLVRGAEEAGLPCDYAAELARIAHVIDGS